MIGFLRRTCSRGAMRFVIPHADSRAARIVDGVASLCQPSRAFRMRAIVSLGSSGDHLRHGEPFMRPARRVQLFVHGVPNAGKTTWLTSLYGLRDRISGEALLTFDHAATNRYLNVRWRHFQEGILPRATALAQPERLLWTMRLPDQVWQVTAIDYAGALVEAGRDPTTAALTTPVCDHLAASDAVLLLLDCAAPDVSQLDAVALLL